MEKPSTLTKIWSASSNLACASWIGQMIPPVIQKLLNSWKLSSLPEAIAKLEEVSVYLLVLSVPFDEIFMGKTPVTVFYQHATSSNLRKCCKTVRFLHKAERINLMPSTLKPCTSWNSPTIPQIWCFHWLLKMHLKKQCCFRVTLHFFVIAKRKSSFTWKINEMHMPEVITWCNFPKKFSRPL